MTPKRLSAAPTSHSRSGSSARSMPSAPLIWRSMNPGATRRPETSIVGPPSGASIRGPTAATRPSTTRTSAGSMRSRWTTEPPASSSRLTRRHRPRPRAERVAEVERGEQLVDRRTLFVSPAYHRTASSPARRRRRRRAGGLRRASERKESIAGRCRPRAVALILQRGPCSGAASRSATASDRPSSGRRWSPGSTRERALEGDDDGRAPRASAPAPTGVGRPRGRPPDGPDLVLLAARPDRAGLRQRPAARTVEWLRDHKMGGLVDTAERRWFATHQARVGGDTQRPHLHAARGRPARPGLRRDHHGPPRSGFERTAPPPTFGRSPGGAPPPAATGSLTRASPFPGEGVAAARPDDPRCSRRLRHKS